MKPAVFAAASKKAMRVALLAVLLAGLQAEDLKDVEYGHPGKYSLRMDLHIPDGAGPFAAVILVHGGDG